MEVLDPTTGKTLSSDAIQRVLFLAPAAHVYNIPPLQSTKGHSASTWTTPASRHIFTARLRIIETDDDSSSPSLKIDIVLEDPSTGQLFAAAPYTDPSVVEPVIDSSRFFAVMVRDPQGRKAMLGVGFEERSDAFDFGVALQEARKSLGLEGRSDGGASRGGKKEEPKAEEPPKDYSLKEGETITVNFGGSKAGRRRPQPDSSAADSGADLQSFALAPPPSATSSASPASGAGSEGGFALPPPPSATDVKTKRRSIRDMGFDDGKFGEFA